MRSREGLELYTITIPASVASLIESFGYDLVDLQLMSSGEKNWYIDTNLLPIIMNPDSTQEEIDAAEYIIDLMFPPPKMDFEEFKNSFKN